MHQELNCPRCEQPFDAYERTPQMLPKCGHSMCMKCLRQQTRIVCPEDGLQQPLDLAAYPVNQTILKIISKSSLRNSQLDSTEVETLRFSNNFLEALDPSHTCLEHHKRIELVCLDDQYKICVSCALFGQHKHHNVRNLEEVVSEIQRNLQDTMQLVNQVQSKVKTLKQPQINKKIRDQIRVCIKQQQGMAEEQFKELITQIMIRQRKTMEEIEHRYKQIEEQMIKKEQSYISQILEKSELWILAAQEKMNQFSQTSEKGDIAFFLLSKDQSNNQAKHIMDDVDDYMRQFQSRLQDVQQSQSQFVVSKDLLSNIECSYPQLQQSFIGDDPNILRDMSMVVDQSFLKDLDDKPPHNEFLIPQLLINNQSPKSQSMLQSQLTQSAMNLQPINSMEKRQPSQHEQISSPKIKRQSSMSPKRPNKKKLTQKVENLISTVQGEILDVSQQDLGDDGCAQLEEQLRGKKFKILKLMRNKISDTGAIKLIDINAQALHLQANVITERFLDMIISILSTKTLQIKTIYLNQNLMNLFRIKKKIEEIRKLGIVIQL
ncbi:hypothetical protein pb186bvf_019168 [Paramecium bursaria]